MVHDLCPHNIMVVSEEESEDDETNKIFSTSSEEEETRREKHPRNKGREKRKLIRDRWKLMRLKIPSTIEKLQIKVDNNEEGRRFFKMVNDVVKIFNSIVDPDDMLYLDRRSQLDQSVETVHRETPAVELCFNGDVEETVDNLLPIVQSLYHMPDLRPDEGTHKWFVIVFPHGL